jgi:hypothetical protein
LQDPDAEIILFDLESDPRESRNIADQHPDIIQEMRLLFESGRTESTEFPLYTQ